MPTHGGDEEQNEPKEERPGVANLGCERADKQVGDRLNLAG